jgi:hypothetical protein
LKKLAARLPKLPVTGQAPVLENLAARREMSALPVALAALKSENTQVRVAAIHCLGMVGDKSTVPLLVEAILAKAPIGRAAREALVVLSGEGTDEAILAALERAAGPQRAALIGVLADRKAVIAMPVLLKEAEAGDPVITVAALEALRTLAEPKDVPALIALLQKIPAGSRRDDLEKTLMAVCWQIPEPNQSQPILTAIAAGRPADRVLLLPVLGRVGGAKAMEAIQAAIRSDQAALHDAGMRALCNWPDASVAAQLLEMSENETKPGNRLRALRAYIRVATIKSDRPAADTLAMLQRAMKLATADEERRLILSRAHMARNMETVRWLAPYLDNPALAQEACRSLVELAHHRFLRLPNRAGFQPVLEKVAKVAEDPNLAARAKRHLTGL